MPSMQPAERERIQQRMRAWANLTPDERARARQNYRELKKTPAEERQRAWERYQQLPAEERARLAAEARSKAAKEPPPDRTGKPAHAIAPKKSARPSVPTHADHAPGSLPPEAKPVTPTAPD